MRDTASTSLSPVPSDTSLFQPISDLPAVPSVRAPTRPRQNEFLEAPRPFKRRRDDPLVKSPRRVRGREDTPIHVFEETTSVGQGDIDLGASAVTGGTADGLSDYRLDVDGDPLQRMQTSEGDGEGEGSVLFSEQVREWGQPTSKTDTMVRNVETEGTEEFVTEARDEQYDVEDDNQDDQDEEEGEDEEDDAIQESQDQSDLEEDDQDHGAEPPAWLTEPHSLRNLDAFSMPPPPDCMSRVIESRSSRSLSSKRHQHPYPCVPQGGIKDVFMDDEPSSPGSYHSGDSELYEMDHRPVLDRTAVKKDIRTFMESFESLYDEKTFHPKYQVIDRLGEGTFSSVYIARDCYHRIWDNEYWTYRSNDPDWDRETVRTDVKVALKKVLATSSPARIENELHILESLRGCRNVSQLITAFREEDQVIIVLPYHQTDDFRHFYRHMDPPRIRSYMRALFQALKDIHKRGIVHRDVKPANFLFDYGAATGVLCDFGLAERYVPPKKPTCQHGPASLSFLHGTKVKTSETTTVEQAVYDARKRARLGEGKIGFLPDDKRPAVKTNRAGTRGFRAPEVLLKCPDQTVAIDVWSAGIMLLSMLTHKFPVFNSSDDIEALMEIAAIFGRPAMEKCATLHNRTIICNVPTLDSAPPTLNVLVTRLNPHIYTPSMQNPSRTDATNHIIAIDMIIDLCSRLLRLDATKRLTAADALIHPFIRGEEEGWEYDEDQEDEEILELHEGKCGHLHGVVHDKHKATFEQSTQEMLFGQGIPPSRDALCPEHEHWQQRTGLNPLTTCLKFPDEEAYKPTKPETRREVVSKAIEDRVNLRERDINTLSHRRG